MKNVLLLVHDDAGEEARFQAALDLTRALSGHLTCFDIVQLPMMVGMDPMVGAAEVAILDDAREREAENRARIETRLHAEDVPWSWVDATGDIAPLLKAECDLADIIVLNTALTAHAEPDMRAAVSEVVTGSGKPVVAVPETARGLATHGNALIAWNGSSEVADTMRALTPLLRVAKSVSIVTFGESERLPVEEAATYLSRHGIEPRIDHRAAESDVAGALLALCADHHPGYCVIGAYSHARLRESLFGGVTRRMLTESRVPLILGH
jgi:nucleotide-binding universal stress UspA family protein